MSKLLIFPTDTVYGIGTSVFDKENISKIYEIKKRPKDKPLAVLCANIEQIESICYLNNLSRLLIKEYMPGALTIIVKAKPNIEESMNLKMVGVRIPNSKIAINILNENGPMATTSVNDSGEAPINDFKVLKEKYGTLVDEVYENDSKLSEIASTVIMIEEYDVKLIREGQIKFEHILKKRQELGSLNSK